MELKLHEAVRKAIEEVGLSAFKRTSLFLSNEKSMQVTAKAA